MNLVYTLAQSEFFKHSYDRMGCLGMDPWSHPFHSLPPATAATSLGFPLLLVLCQQFSTTTVSPALFPQPIVPAVFPKHIHTPQGSVGVVHTMGLLVCDLLDRLLAAKIVRVGGWLMQRTAVWEDLIGWIKTWDRGTHRVRQRQGSPPCQAYKYGSFGDLSSKYSF